MSKTMRRVAASAPVGFTGGVLTPLGVSDARLLSGFWGDRQALNTTAIISHALGWMHRLGWVQNFAGAASGRRYEHRGREFADTEIYKVIEAISWDIARGSDTHREALDELVQLVVAAQDPDGYLQTLFGRPWQRPRYSDFQWGHELYCFGHFFQAAVAHHRATGETTLLEAARKLADHVCTMFAPGGLNHVCGHAEIELGLAELYRETGEQRYLEQASVFIERRGEGTIPLHEFGRAFWQDDIKVRDADVLRGHAVRALYLAAGATDVAAETGDSELFAALESQWQRTVARRTYITGGMGSHHMDEAFGDDFVLPPDRSYCETCAGVASNMFSWRMLLATGAAKYAELMERTLYNIVAVSPSSDGRAFFYANTLHQRVAHTPPSLNEDGVVIRGGASGRQPWFEVSCCPPNVARTLASLGAYAVTETADAVQVHQYASGRFRTSHGDLTVETDYPQSGRVDLYVDDADDAVSVAIRVPSWVTDARLSSDGMDAAAPAGEYATITIAPGSHAVLTFTVAPRVSRADDRVDAVRGCIAIERGPEVLALESVDLPDGWGLGDVQIVVGEPTESDGTVSVEVARMRRREDPGWAFGAPEATEIERARVPLVPYHDWAERGPSTMRIWIPVHED